MIEHFPPRYERSTIAPTQPLVQRKNEYRWRDVPPIFLDAFPLIDVGIRFVVCLAAIAFGLWLAVNSANDAQAAAAALAVGGVIYALLSPKRGE